MLNKAVITASILNAFLLLGACKQSCTNIDIVEIQQEMKDWAEFLPGTYWIYKDSISAELDTIFIYDYQRKLKETIFNQTNCPTYRQREIYLNFPEDSIYNPKNYEFHGIYKEEAQDSLVGEMTFRKKSERSLQSPFLIFPLRVGTNKRYGSRSFFKTESILKSMVVLDNNFDSIVVTHDNFCYPANGPARFYHAKNTGVIKKVIFEQNNVTPTAVWELIEWNIIQN